MSAMSARAAAGALALAAALAASASAGAQQMEHHHHGATPAAKQPPAVFTASSQKPFAALMGEAMAIMDRDMAAAPMNGEAGHDFVTMMLPHHQGAVDMAKAVLLHTRDPELRNLALGIIAEQQNEINVMRAWLERQHTQTRK
jgi:uncharacterized protein (DUF305 family)